MASRATSSCPTNKKRALLMGNNDYKSRTKLQFCVNDTEDLAKKLRIIGFEVTIGINQTYEEMNRMIEEFNTEICAGDLVLFLFAGYGCQWNKENVLIPVDDDRMEESMDFTYRTVNVQKTLQEIKSRNPFAIIFLFGCCRNYFKGSLFKSNDLSSLQPVRDSFIIFACDGDKSVSDKSINGRNSLFTTYLLKHIAQPNLAIDEIIYDVCDDLMEETNGDQSLFRVSALRKEVYLNQSVQSKQNSPSISSPINIKWLQHGVTVAGGNDYGNQLNQLSHPQGVYVDDDHQCIYVADTKNHRIVQWKFGADSGEVVAGGNGDGHQMNQLSCPRDVILDKNTDSLIICDYGNRRILRWARINGQSGQIIISDIDCCGLTMNKNGNLYVSDHANNEIRRWREGETEGVIIAGGNGKGREYDKLRFPTYIFVDGNETIYVSDCWNHRVMKWVKGANKGILVAGKKGVCNIDKELRTPQGIVVDHSGRVYVADSGSHRIMCWTSESKQGHIIIAGIGEGQQSNQFSGLRGLAFDRQNNFYVVDCYNNRVLKFDVDRN